jgi:hypothetical protein
MDLTGDNDQEFPTDLENIDTTNQPYEFGSDLSHGGWTFSDTMELSRPPYPSSQFISPSNLVYDPTTALPDTFENENVYLSPSGSLTGTPFNNSAQDFSIFPSDFDPSLFDDRLNDSNDMTNAPPTFHRLETTAPVDFGNAPYQPDQYQLGRQLQTQSPTFNPPTTIEEVRKRFPASSSRGSSSKPSSRKYNSPIPLSHHTSSTSKLSSSTKPSPRSPTSTTSQPSPNSSRHNHNAIEKKYRTSLNAKFQTLKEALPLKPLVEEEYDVGRKTMSKADILLAAVKRIKELEATQTALETENGVLVRSIEELEKARTDARGDFREAI